MFSEEFFVKLFHLFHAMSRGVCSHNSYSSLNEKELFTSILDTFQSYDAAQSDGAYLIFIVLGRRRMQIILSGENVCCVC